MKRGTMEEDRECGFHFLLCNSSNYLNFPSYHKFSYHKCIVFLSRAGKPRALCSRQVLYHWVTSPALIFHVIRGYSYSWIVVNFCVHSSIRLCEETKIHIIKWEHTSLFAFISTRYTNYSKMPVWICSA